MPVVDAVPQEHAAAPARDRAAFFQCYLADQPEFLVPERLLASAPAGPLTVSRNVSFTWREPLPDSIAEIHPLPEMFLGGDMLWVDDSVTGMQRPFWIGPWFQQKLAGLARGQRAPVLAPHHTAALYAAGVLEHPGDTARRASEWNTSIQNAADSFARDGVATLPGLIHPFHLGALRRYYRRMVRTGGMPLGDSGSPLRHVAYNESVARSFHWQIAGVVSAAAGTAVRPTFAYVAAYQGGADLETHTDRAQCQYAVSLLLDFVPEIREQSPWPLVMHTHRGAQNIWQSLGDAVLYRGTEIPHERARLASDASSTSLLFYFVDEDFDGPLD